MQTLDFFFCVFYCLKRRPAWITLSRTGCLFRTCDSELSSGSGPTPNIKIFSQPALLLPPICHLCALVHGPEAGSGEGDSRVMNRGHGALFGRRAAGQGPCTVCCSFGEFSLVMRKERRPASNPRPSWWDLHSPEADAGAVGLHVIITVFLILAD